MRDIREDGSAPEFTFAQHGFDLIRRGQDDDHVLVVVYSEDDGYWHYKDSFSSHWVSQYADMVALIATVLKDEDRFVKDPSGFGMRFK